MHLPNYKAFIFTIKFLKSKVKVRKDKKLIRILNSKRTYLILLLPVIAYYLLDAKILNEPVNLILLKALISAAILILFLYARYTKFKEYYIEFIKQMRFLDSLICLTGLLFTGIILQAIISIPLYLFVIAKAQKSDTEYFDCKIRNVVTTGADKIHFEFKGKRYSQKFNTAGYSRKELLNSYHLKVAVKKSIANMYVLENLKLERNE